MLIKSHETGTIVNLAHVVTIEVEHLIQPLPETWRVSVRNQVEDSLWLFSGTEQACLDYKTWLEKQLRNAGILLPDYVPTSEPAPKEEELRPQLSAACIVEICYQISALDNPVSNLAKEIVFAIAGDYAGFVNRLRGTDKGEKATHQQRMKIWEEWNLDGIPF